MKKLIFLFLQILLITLSTHTMAEEPTTTPEEKIMVDSIFFEDDEGVRLTNPTMSLIISHQVGKELNAEKLMEDSSELTKRFPEYEDVTVRVDPGKDEKSVILVFEFQRKRMVESMRIIIHDGAVENNKLSEKLRTTKGKLLRGSDLNSDRQVLKDEYIKMGYPNVEVTQQINVADQAAKTVNVIFNVLPKSRQAFVHDMVFIGNKNYKKLSLLKMMEVRKNLWYLLDFKRRIFDINQLKEDIKLLVEAYHDIGYANVKIEPDFALTDHKNKKRGANTLITMKIDEGEQFKVHAIKVEGPKEFKAETIRSLIKYKLGTFYSGKIMRQELQKVREFYGERGYAMAKVLMDYQSKDGTVTIKIEEGKKHIIDEIKIVGNMDMKESLILRDVTFVPGQIVNVKEIRKTLSAMKKTAYYDDVRVDYQPKSETSGVIIIEVTEASNHYIEFGGGYSSVGFGGEVAYNNPNLFNTGKAMSILGTKSEELLRLSVMYNDP
ncbi:MAG: POTRA domain-containing protein, partial [Bdellovibrionota bacterium]